VILVVGLLSEGTNQAILIGTGLLLCSVAGLELAIREHLGGYRSHTLVLAAVPAVAVLGVLFYLAPAGIGPPIRLAIAAAVFGLCAWGFTVAFRNRSGGYNFRVKAPRRPR
jgi:RsiW-degrading membrane proteinase PrsW (M82 family)